MILISTHLPLRWEFGWGYREHVLVFAGGNGCEHRSRFTEGVSND